MHTQYFKDFLSSYGFKYHPYATNIHIFIFCTDMSFKPEPHILKWLLNTTIKQKWKEFITTRPSLQDMLKGAN